MAAKTTSDHSILTDTQLQEEMNALRGQLEMEADKHTQSLIAEITADKLVLEKLLASEVFYDSVIDALSDGLVVQGIDDKILMANRAAADILGLSMDQLLGKDSYDPRWQATHDDGTPFRPEDHPSLITIRTGQPVDNVIMQVSVGDGKRRTISINSRPVLDKGQHLIGAVVTFRNITERLRIDAALRESEERFRNTFEQAAVGIGHVSSEGRFLRVNQRLCDLVGYSQTEMVNLTFPAITHPDDLETDLAYMQQMLAGEIENYAMEKRYIHKNGSPIWINLTVSLVRKSTGEPLYFISVIEDISPRKEAEAELIRLKEEYYSLAENSPDLIARFDKSLRHLFVNSAAAKAGVLSPDEYVGRTIAESGVPEPAASAWGKRIRQVFETGEMVDVVDSFPTPQGTQYFHTRLVPEMDDKNMVLSVLSLARDVTERQRVEERVRRLNVELEERVEARTQELRSAQVQLVRQGKLAVLGQMAGSVGHELRNPLGIISNAIYFLKLVQPEANQKIKEYLSLIERETHNAEKIINDLLDFARVKSVDRERIVVTELMQAVLVRFLPPASINVSMQIPEDLPPIFADRRHLEQILGNLVTNGYQAMADGGCLSVRCERRQEMIGIAIEDNGVGIPQENMQNLFEPLFTTKAKGIGLGLALSSKLAEANGGHITVDSEEGVGSTFTLWLPADKDHSA